jgi:hypothetical protein
VKTFKNTLLLALAAGVLPLVAHAQIIVNTGTPTGTNPPAVLYPAQSLAAEFSVTAGETIGTLSAYLNQGTAQPNDFFTFNIYQTLPGRNGSSPVYSISDQWTQNGWNSITASWTPTNGGNYWLALTQPNVGYQFSVPSLTSSSTGNPPALGFEYSGVNGQYTANSAPTFGVEILAAPEPASWTLALVCAATFAFWRFRRTSSARS